MIHLTRLRLLHRVSVSCSCTRLRVIVQRANHSSKIVDENNESKPVGVSKPITTAETTDQGVGVVSTQASDVSTQAADQLVFHNHIIHLLRTGSLDKDSLDRTLTYFQTKQFIAEARTWHAMMTGLLNAERYTELQQLWQSWYKITPSAKSTDKIQQMKAENRLPTADVFALLLRIKPAIIKPNQVLALLKKWDMQSNQFLHNSIIKDMIKQRDYTSAGSYLVDMNSRKILPDIFTISLHLSMIKQRENKEGKAKHRSSTIAAKNKLWDRCMELGLEPPASMLLNFMSLFRDTVDFVRTAQMVDYVIRHNVKIDSIHVYHDMLSVLMKRDRVDSILKMYGHLRNTGVAIDLRMYEIMMTALHRQRDLGSIQMLYDELIDSGMSPNAQIFNVLLRTYAVYGDVPAMKDVFTRMTDLQIEANVMTFDYIQRGICQWYWNVLFVQEGQSNNQSSKQASNQNIYSDYDLSSESLRLDESAYHIQLQPLSTYLLPWMHLMNKDAKTERIYKRMLLALCRDGDIQTLLYYLNEMMENGVPHSDGGLIAVIKHLNNVDVFGDQERNQAMQLMSLCDQLIAQNVAVRDGNMASVLDICNRAGLSDHASKCHERMTTVIQSPT